MISVESFGWRHPGALSLLRGDALVIDLAEKLHDPNVKGSKLQHMTGLDSEVYDHVTRTYGAWPLFQDIADRAIALYAATSGDLRVLIACRGGRHRSVVAARVVADLLRDAAWPVETIHHHIEQPVLPPAPPNRVRVTQADGSSFMCADDNLARVRASYPESRGYTCELVPGIDVDSTDHGNSGTHF